MMRSHTAQHQRGAIVTTVLVFTAMAMVMITAAVALVVTNTSENAVIAQGMRAQFLAESGIENALLRLLRNPYYTGETLMIDSIPVEIIVSGAQTKVIRAEAQIGQVRRDIQVTATYDAGVLTPTKWEEL